MGRESRGNPNSRENTPPPPNAVLDCRGRILREGDEVIVALQNPPFFRVSAIHPSLHPQAPPGAMEIVFSAAYKFGAMRGAINPEFIRVQTVEEAGPLKPPTGDQAPATEGPRLTLVGSPAEEGTAAPLDGDFKVTEAEGEN